jgi:hypothetical protein
MSARDAFLDLGLKYTARMELYTSGFLLVYSTLILFAFGCLLDIFTYLPMTSEFLYMLIFDTAVIFLIIFRMLHIGAHVNSSFGAHRGVLLQIKSDLVTL